jgi:hypothetical protein
MLLLYMYLPGVSTDDVGVGLMLAQNQDPAQPWL